MRGGKYDSLNRFSVDVSHGSFGLGNRYSCVPVVGDFAMIRRVTPEPSFLQARKILGLRESVMVFTGKGWISRERDESEKDEIVEWAHFYLCTDRFVPRPTESELESFRTQIEIKRAAA